ncbi:MAG: hypothetical protein AB8B71_04610 [Paracoccaceae bacterium]
MNYPFDLGTYSRPVTDKPDAQIWFDRAMVWLYGFNHEEAIACLERTLAADPSCAMAHWGIAYALGPNYNKPWEIFDPREKAPCITRSNSAIKSGLAVAQTPQDIALLHALSHRIPDDPDVEDFQPYADGFADAMRDVHARWPEDLDITSIFAESLMNRTPWRLWDFWKGCPNPKGSAVEAQSVLETAFKRDAAWHHPGLLHMYIHLMEMSPTPELALRHGDRLTGLAPDAGHLVHMGTHIDVLCGDYQTVVARNLAAAEVDKTFKSYAGGANFYALYRIHNLHFALYGAMFLGQRAAALEIADRLRAEVPDEVVRVYPDLFETFVATKSHVLIRFGMWQDILHEPIPVDTQLYAVTHALVLYARAIAFANLGHEAQARKEAAAFEIAFAAIPEERQLFQNKARDVLELAHHMMWGEVMFKSGAKDEGLDHLRQAVHCDDGLLYEEPWAWPLPTRHALGALLMDAGHMAEAEAVYRADLGFDPTLPRPCQNPRNVWALQGLYECLVTRGEHVERPHIKALLDQAAARADIVIRASCLCRATN